MVECFQCYVVVPSSVVVVLRSGGLMWLGRILPPGHWSESVEVMHSAVCPTSSVSTSLFREQSWKSTALQEDCRKTAKRLQEDYRTTVGRL